VLTPKTAERGPAGSDKTRFSRTRTLKEEWLRNGGTGKINGNQRNEKNSRHEEGKSTLRKIRKKKNHHRTSDGGNKVKKGEGQFKKRKKKEKPQGKGGEKDRGTGIHQFETHREGLVTGDRTNEGFRKRGSETTQTDKLGAPARVCSGKLKGKPPDLAQKKKRKRRTTQKEGAVNKGKKGGPNRPAQVGQDNAQKIEKKQNRGLDVLGV